MPFGLEGCLHAFLGSRVSVPRDSVTIMSNAGSDLRCSKSLFGDQTQEDNIVTEQLKGGEKLKDTLSFPDVAKKV